MKSNKTNSHKVSENFWNLTNNTKYGWTDLENKNQKVPKRPITANLQINKRNFFEKSGSTMYNFKINKKNPNILKKNIKENKDTVDFSIFTNKELNVEIPIKKELYNFKGRPTSTFNIEKNIRNQKYLEKINPKIPVDLHEAKKDQHLNIVLKNNRPHTAAALLTKNEPIELVPIFNMEKQKNQEKSKLNEKEFINEMDKLDVIDDYDELSEIEEEENFKFEQNKFEDLKKKNFKINNRVKSNINTNIRPITALKKNQIKRPISGVEVYKTRKIMSSYVKKKLNIGAKRPYEEIFNRNERTRCASFSVFGDLKYYSPSQRIGSFMQYTEKLKMIHLKEIINLKNKVTQIDKVDFEIPIQLAVINDDKPYLKQEKNGWVLYLNKYEVSKETITTSLYPEFFGQFKEIEDYVSEDEDEEEFEEDKLKNNKKYFNMIYKKMNYTYDPSYYSLKKDLFMQFDLLPENIKNLYFNSIERYNHYLNSDIIKKSDISNFKKEWMLRALSFIKETVIKENEHKSKEIFREILDNYTISMKKIILNYFLKSPEERKRLHINLLFKDSLNSSEKIFRNGGYSIELYKEWNFFYQNGKKFANNNIYIFKNVINQINNWFHDFKDIRIFDYEIIKIMSYKGNSLSFEEFIKIQTLYKNINIEFLKNIWIKGIYFLLRFGKMLRGHNLLKGRWITSGFISKESNIEKLDIEEIYSKLNSDFHSNNNINLFSSILNYIHNENIKNCDFSIDDLNQFEFEDFPDIDPEYNFKDFTDEEKIKLKNSWSVLLSQQIRKILMKSLNNISNLFLNKENIMKVNLSTKKIVTSEKSLAKLDDISFSNEYSIYNQNVPFLKLTLEIDNLIIKFSESEDFIMNEFNIFYKEFLESFDYFLNPNNTKITIEDKNKIDFNFQKKNINFDKIPNNSEDISNFFSSYFPFINLKEKIQKKKLNNLFEKDSKDKQENKYLKILEINDNEIRNKGQLILNHIISLYNECKQIFTIFDKFKKLNFNKLKTKIEQILDAHNYSFAEIKKFYLSLKEYLEELEKIPNKFYFSLFEVDTQKVKKFYIDMINDIINKLILKIEETLSKNILNFNNKYKDIIQKLKTPLNNTDDFKEMDTFLISLHEEKYYLLNQTKEIIKKYMDYSKINICLENILNSMMELWENPKLLEKEISTTEINHINEKSKLEDNLKDMKKVYDNKINQLILGMDIFSAFGDYKNYQKYLVNINKFEDELNDVKSLETNILDDEFKLFKITSNYEKIVEIEKEVSPIIKLWKLIDNFMNKRKKLLSSKVYEIDYDEFFKEYKNTKIGILDLEKINMNDQTSKNVIDNFKLFLTEIKSILPIIYVISYKDLKDRHWESINEIIKFKFDNKNNNLYEILSLDLVGYQKDLESIIYKSNKENNLLNMLNVIKNEWTNKELPINELKELDIKYIKGTDLDNIFTILDEHTIKAQSIKLNPFSEFMEDEVNYWFNSLKTLQKILEIFIIIQKKFIYLQPLFLNNDLRNKLELETKEYQMIEDFWVNLFKYFTENKFILNIINYIDIENLLNENIIKLEKIFKGIEVYLNSKRSLFPRFYFLSNEEILDILSKSDEITKTQPKLNRIFTGINNLIFTSVNEVVGCSSKNKEELMFLEKLLVKEYSNTEDWFIALESKMQNAIKLLIIDNIKDNLEGRLLIDCIRKYINQSIILSLDAYWTSIIEEKMVVQKGFKELLEIINENIEEMIEFLKTDLIENELIKVSNVIIKLINKKEIITKLSKLKIHSSSNFNWKLNFRLYLEEMEPVEMSELKLEIGDNKLYYGYEYIGSGQRLILTPISDKCFYNLSYCFNKNYYSVVLGETGYGKSEIINEFSNMLGNNYVSYIINENTDLDIINNLIIGSISSSSFINFENFENIKFDYLSAISQNLINIFNSKYTDKTKYFYNNIEINIKNNFFINFNCHDNNKNFNKFKFNNIFRKINLLKPDLSYIIEIYLKSFGYVNSFFITKKILLLFEYLKKNLNEHNHYDFSIRYIFNFIHLLNNQKKIEEDEIYMIYKLINKIITPVLIDEDIPIFKNIIEEIFGKSSIEKYKTYENEKNNDSSLNIKYYLNFLDKFNFKNKKKIIAKFEEFKNILEIKNSIILYGNTFTGKSTFFKEYINFLSSSYGLSTNILHKFNPKAINKKRLYGYKNSTTEENFEGLIYKYIKDILNQKENNKHYFLFEANIEEKWIDILSSSFDENRILSFPNSDKIILNNNIFLIFESQKLDCASPSTLSKCYTIYFNEDNISDFNFIETSVDDFFSDVLEDNLIEYIKNLFDTIFFSVLNFLKKMYNFNFNPKIYIKNILSILYSFWKEFEEDDNINKKKFKKLIKFDTFASNLNMDDAVSDEEDYYLTISQKFIFSLIWGFTCSLEKNIKLEISKFIIKLIKEPLKCENRANIVINIPDKCLPSLNKDFSLFDYCYDENLKKWINLNNYSRILNPIKVENDLFIETAQTLQQKFIISLCIENEIPLWLEGPKSSGKSNVINNFISYFKPRNFVGYKTIKTSNDKDDETKKSNSLKLSYDYNNIYCNKNFNETNFQLLIENKLERKKKGIFGPKGINSKLIIILEDINLATKNNSDNFIFEIWKQIIKDDYIFESNESKRIEINDMNFLSVSSINFNINKSNDDINSYFFKSKFHEIEESILKNIFSIKIKNFFFNKNNLNSNLLEFKNIKNIIDASVSIIYNLKNELKPIPNKPYYFFNFKDIESILEGLKFYKINNFSDPNSFVKIFIYEIMSKINEKLITKIDKKLLVSELLKSIKYIIREDINKILDIKDYKLQYKNIKQNDEINTNILDHFYYKFEDIKYTCILNDGEEISFNNIKDIKDLKIKLFNIMNNYNEINNSPINIIFFDYAIQKILVMLKNIVQFPHHMVLISDNGIGRKVYTKFIAFILNYDFLSLENLLIKDENKKILLIKFKSELIKISLKDNKTVIVLNYKQKILLEILDEYIKNYNFSDFVKEDFNEYENDIILIAKKDNIELKNDYESIYNYFLKKIKENLIIVLLQSNNKEKLRKSNLLWNNFYNESHIIYFNKWDSNVLSNIGEFELKNIKFYENDKIIDTKNLNTTMIRIYENYIITLKSYSQKLKDEINYHPSIYIDFIKYFIKYYNEYKKYYEDSINNYKNGIDILKKTKIDIIRLKKELNDKKPILDITKVNLTNNLKELEIEKEIITPEYNKIKEEQIIIENKKSELEILSKKIEENLGVHLINFNKILKNVDNFDYKELNNLIGMTSPPIYIKIVLEALFILLNKSNNIIKGKDNWKFISQNIKNIVYDIKNFELDNCDPNIFKRLRKEYISNKEFNSKKIEKSFLINELYKWIKTVNELEKKNFKIKPLKEELKVNKEDLEDFNNKYIEKEKELKIKEVNFKSVEEKYKKTNDKFNNLEKEIIQLNLKVKRSEILIQILDEEKVNWKQKKLYFEEMNENIYGNTILFTMGLTFYGILNLEFRLELLKKVKMILRDNYIKYSTNYSFCNYYHKNNLKFNWFINGLNKDDISLENSIIIYENSKFCFIVDPQEQYNKFLKSNETNNNLIILNFKDKNFEKIEKSIENGSTVIIKNCNNKIPSQFNNLLRKNIYKNFKNKDYIYFNNKSLHLNNNFRLFLHTSEKGLKFPIETWIKTNIINFNLDENILKDIFLDNILKIEKKELYDNKEKLLIQKYKLEFKIFNIEAKLLEILNNQKNDILENETAIEILKESKLLSQDAIKQKNVILNNSKKIEEIRKNYEVITIFISKYYSCILKMYDIKEYYIFSFQWFLKIFEKCLNNSQKSNFIEQRIENILNNLPNELLNYLSPCLLYKDKIILGILFWIENKLLNKELTEEEINILLYKIKSGFEKESDDKSNNNNESERKYSLKDTSVIHNGKELDEFNENWLNESQWEMIKFLNNSKEVYNNLALNFHKNKKKWKYLVESKNIIKLSFPEPFNNLNNAEKLVLVKILKPEYYFDFMKTLLKNELKLEIEDNSDLDLNLIFNKLKYNLPIMFLNPDKDLLLKIKDYYKQIKRSDNIKYLSISKNKEINYLEFIKEGLEKGYIIIFDNINYKPEFFTTLIKIYKQVFHSNKKHPSFKIIILVDYSKHIPIYLIRNSFKILQDKKLNIKEEVKKLTNYCKLEIQNYDIKNENINRILFSLICFHIILSQRTIFKKYAFLKKYKFDFNDFKIAFEGLMILLKCEKNQITFSSIKKLLKENIYGVKIKSYYDLNIINYVAKDIFYEGIFSEYFQLQGFENFDLNEVDKMNFSIIFDNLQKSHIAEIVGLNKDVSKIRYQNEINYLKKSVDSLNLINDKFFIKVENTTTNNSNRHLNHQDSDKIVKINYLLKAIPPLFKLNLIKVKYPLTNSNSFNLLLYKETCIYNNIIQKIKYDLEYIIDIHKGAKISNDYYDKFSKDLNKNKYPKCLKNKYYSKDLSFYECLKDFKNKYNFFNAWIDKGFPQNILINMLFQPELIFICLKRNYSLLNNCQIEKIEISFEFLKPFKENNINNCRFISNKIIPIKVGMIGLNLSGANWDYIENKIVEDDEYNKISSKTPLIVLEANVKFEQKGEDILEVPIFKDDNRNEIIEFIEAKIDSIKSKWIKRNIGFVIEEYEE